MIATAVRLTDDGFFPLSLCAPSSQSAAPRPAPAEGSLSTPPPPPLSRPLPPGRLPCSQPARSPSRSGMTLGAPSPCQSRHLGRALPRGRPHLWLVRPRGLRADPATRLRLRNGGAGRRLPPRSDLPGAAPGASPAGQQGGSPRVPPAEQQQQRAGAAVGPGTKAARHGAP
ncbi:unnamed protein product [Coccothraustes coccothraustes]